MKKILLILALLLLSIGLVGCGSAGLSITVTPNPMVFNSGENLIEGTIKVEITGFGSLTINGIIVEVVENSTENPTQLLLFNTDEHPDELPVQFPITTPVAFQGMYSEEFDIQELLASEDYDGDGFTVNDLIENVSTDSGIASYEDLKGKTYLFKVTVNGEPSTYKEIEIIFQ